MARKGNKVFIVVKYGKFPSIKAALKDEFKMDIIAIINKPKEIANLAEAIGTEVNPPEWSDDEEVVPEMGFKTKSNRSRHRGKS